MKKLIFLSVVFLSLGSINAFSSSGLRLQRGNNLPQNPITLKAQDSGGTEFWCEEGTCHCNGAEDCVNLNKYVPSCHNYDCKNNACTCDY